MTSDRNNKDNKQIIQGGEPFLCDAGGDIACLAVHGYTDTPQIYRQLAERLREGGISTNAILLSSHGRDDNRVHPANSQQWLQEVQEAYQEMSRRYQSVILMGFSMGALLALNAAKSRPPKALVLLAPFLRLTRYPFANLPFERWVDRMAKWRFMKRLYVPSPVPMDIRDPQARADFIHSKYFSLSSTVNVLQLAHHTKEILPDITAPMVVIHSTNDRVAHPQSARECFHRVGSKVKRLHFVQNSGHAITVDHEKEVVFDLILDFLEQLDLTKGGENA